MSIRIVLADDHQIVRQGLKSVLESEPEFKVVGEASGGNEAVKLVEKLKPDVLVCDLMMDGTTGFETARMVNAVSPSRNVWRRSETWLPELRMKAATRYSKYRLALSS